MRCRGAERGIETEPLRAALPARGGNHADGISERAVIKRETRDE
jgi:hypothetical protein